MELLSNNPEALSSNKGKINKLDESVKSLTESLPQVICVA